MTYSVLGLIKKPITIKKKKLCFVLLLEKVPMSRTPCVSNIHPQQFDGDFFFFSSFFKIVTVILNLGLVGSSPVLVSWELGVLIKVTKKCNHPSII